MPEKRFAFMVPVTFAKDADPNTARSFEGVAYSGGVVTDHPMFEAVVIDLATTRFKTPAPLMFSHDHLDPVGTIEVAKIDSQIRIAGHLFAGVGGSSEKIAKMADQGMPWQMSVGVYPGSREEVKAGASVKVNGQQIAGPVVVFRNNRIRETSICSLGADDRTNAEIFYVGDPDPLNQPREASKMDQAEHDRIVGELKATIAKLEEKNAALSGQLAAIETAAKAAEAAKRTEDIAALEKEAGKEFTAEERNGFAKMDPTTFEFVSKQIRATKPALDPKLMEHQATDGAAPQDDSVESIRSRARAHIEAQSKAGIDVSIADAVSFVTRKAA